MAKKRPMTAAERVRKHRAEKATKRQINITLPSKTISKLDRQAKRAGQTRSEFMDALIASINANAPKVKQETVTSNKKKITPSKKKKTTKTTPTKRTRKEVEVTLDAIGLFRLETFKDFPGAVSVSPEVKDIPTMNRATGQRGVKSRSLPRKFMAVWEAQKHINAFRKTHSDAAINQRYMVEDKTIMEITATYEDDRPDHRVVYQARSR